MSKLLFLLLALIPISTWAQFGDNLSEPLSFSTKCDASNVNLFIFERDSVKIQKASVNTQLYCNAIGKDCDIQWSDFKLTGVTPEGDKIYQLYIEAKGAQAISVQFEKLNLADDAKLWIINSKKEYIGMYTSKDVYKSDHFITSFLEGDFFTIEYVEPKSTHTQDLNISKIYYGFRGFKSSTATGFGQSSRCMLNAFCSEGNNYRGSVDATCKIFIYGGGNTYLCTGSLINNTREDGTPYILTANHCSQYSVLADLVDWEFLFYYQGYSCQNPGSEPIVNKYKGCSAMAFTASDNGEYSSDFLLVKLTNPLPTNLIDFTFIGWDRSSEANGGGVCFHHPAGDIKKVSTYFNTPRIASYKLKVPGTHYEVNWNQTINGFSVTQEGSSGSGLLNSAGRLIGTLTGGGSSCSNVNAPDYYGRMFYHWDKNFNGSTNPQTRLKDWLDPINSNQMTVKTSFASTLGIKSPVNKAQYHINYFKDKLVLNSTISKFTTRVYNLLGQKITELNTSSSIQEVNIENWQKGMYFIEIEQLDNKHLEKFIIK